VTPVHLKYLYHKHGAFSYVRRVGGKVVWTRLAVDMPTALLKYHEILPWPATRGRRRRKGI
jgi:hypothetical protein